MSLLRQAMIDTHPHQFHVLRIKKNRISKPLLCRCGGIKSNKKKILDLSIPVSKLPVSKLPYITIKYESSPSTKLGAAGLG
jgi:hypothetical protein